MKWWFSDFDGTIQFFDSLKSEEFVDKRDIDFINRFVEKENKFIIATGRPLNDILKQIKNHNFKCDYVITNNGATLNDLNGKQIFNKTISMESRDEIVKVMKKWNGLCGMRITIGNQLYYASNVKDKTIYLEEPLNRAFWLKDDPNLFNFEQCVEEVRTNPELNNVAFYFYIRDINEIQKDLNQIRDAKVIQTVSFVIEVMSFQATKKAGIDFLKKEYKFQDKDVIVSGDGENDLEMLAGFENSFAMQTGVESIKKVAKHIIKNVHEIEKIIK